ncbi:hypothetical protein SK128_022131 [Halocaridina rubra]|uniref:Carbohydrate sulfotransferase n=1 Tax=Halocaridina rubra TaxID=373956 RepID=A0AAN8XEA5_HALRR
MSTTWKTHIIRMNSNYLTSPEGYDPHHTKDILLSSNREYLKTEVFQSTIKVITVRHPFQRLVSAYRDKFHNGQKIPIPRTKSEKLKFLNFMGPVLASLNLTHRFYDNNLYLTFEEFVKFIIKDGLMSINRSTTLSNPHWLPYYRLCHPCHINYDFIIEMDHAEEEMTWLSRHLNITEISPNLSLNKQPSIEEFSDLMEKYFNSLPPRLYERLVSLLSFDFHLFNYVIPQQGIRTK